MIVSLSKFAAVRAALSDGFSVSESLEASSVSEGSWRESLAHYNGTLLSDDEELAAFEVAFEDAQDNLARDVDPLSDDLSSWVGFGLKAEDVGFQAVCEEYGLTAGDIGRLSRQWRKRLDDDEALADEARAMREEQPAPSAPPSVTIGERKPACADGHD